MDSGRKMAERLSKSITFHSVHTSTQNHEQHHATAGV